MAATTKPPTGIWDVSVDDLDVAGRDERGVVAIGADLPGHMEF
ncbi:MAG TPA: hypothetical protein VMV92_30090 [Streptosporangiaceae bacterium]|nr:hypothetical protein [Streptosporangiaceae bacterium]